MTSKDFKKRMLTDKERRKLLDIIVGERNSSLIDHEIRQRLRADNKVLETAVDATREFTRKLEEMKGSLATNIAAVVILVNMVKITYQELVAKEMAEARKKIN